MPSEKTEETTEERISYNKKLWPLYLLNGFQSIAYGGIIVLVVPLSLIFWPDEPVHSFEMGLIYTTLAWSGAFSGLLFGRIIDKYSRKNIIILISIFRGISMFLLGFAVEGAGLTTWGYFMLFIAIFGAFSGGTWPAVISISNDVVPKAKRSRFFGVYEIVRNTTNIFGWLFTTALVQLGFWREYFWFIGIAILIGGVLFTFTIDEPKRGSQQEELYHVLKDGTVEYNYEIDLEMIRRTMLSKTNMVALIEGIFTWILMSSLNFMILNYVQTPPINIAPFSTSVFLITFGLTGGLIGQLILARLSDRLAEKKPIVRLPIIVIAIVGGLITFALFFFLDWPHLTVEEGKDVLYLMSLPTIWIMGGLFFASRSVFSLYLVNQSPVLQEINLPEAQGQIISWNQFLEAFGRGIGPIICGALLLITSKNYQITVLFIVLCIIPGVVLWIAAVRWYPDDKEQIREILEDRARELQKEKEQEPSRRLLKP
ncbi:MAG: Arabinose efflux permease family protein [Promethearchaeota archaeon]|nr:MAG: Arabinose efflux permease family protein [Candidatus Lokiarchaeota archaeon]